jgi:hypothetical protein
MVVDTWASATAVPLSSRSLDFGRNCRTTGAPAVFTEPRPAPDLGAVAGRGAVARLLVHAGCCCCRPACSRRCTTRDDERRHVCGGRRRGRSGVRPVRRWPPPRASISSAWRWCSVSRKEKREGFVLWEKEEGEEGTVSLVIKGRGIRKRMFHVVWAPFVRPAS